MKKIIVMLVFIISASGLFAQDKQEVTPRDYANTDVEMADQFRSEGKIYVLTGVILLILGGLVGYMVVIDRKIGHLEKQLPNHDIEKPF